MCVRNLLFLVCASMAFCCRCWWGCCELLTGENQSKNRSTASTTGVCPFLSLTSSFFFYFYTFRLPTQHTIIHPSIYPSTLCLLSFYFNRLIRPVLPLAWIWAWLSRVRLRWLNCVTVHQRHIVFFVILLLPWTVPTFFSLVFASLDYRLSYDRWY